ncbi:MAG: molybdopterin molybdenumtransferase MoeA [Gammaproteobacteria bacterium]|nr:MAG: molybdopterin molybdenumtransferase MoeA [Gammaproteobacteria bacterium]
MMAADDARRALIEAAVPLTEFERVHLTAALGRVLASDVTSPLDVPGHDNSAMDGYAVRAADTGEGGALLPVSQRIAAGHPGGPLAPGTAARIFTGAPMPEGADAVVMQEEVEVDGERIRIGRRVESGENVRPRANDVARGDVVLRAGERLRPQMIGLLASLGIPEVEVVRRLRVALLNTGDEIIEPGLPLAEGQIYNSNRYTLTAALQQLGCEVVDPGPVEDTLEATRAALREAAAQADLVVTSGGVSVGEEDHIRAAVEAEGELALWRVRMKPGKPLAFGRVGDTPFIGLPGNPVSVFVTLCLFGVPFIRIAEGRRVAFPEPMRARLAHAVEKPLKRREFIRVRLEHQADDLPRAVPFPRQGSDVLSSTVWADGILEIPEGMTYPEGTALNFWSFESLLQ